MGTPCTPCTALVLITRDGHLSSRSQSQPGRRESDGEAQNPPTFQGEMPCHRPSPPFPALPTDRNPSLSLRPLITQRPGSGCPSRRGFQLMHSVINQWRSQGQWGWGGQTSLSLCQQGMLEITRHTTLIDAATVYTPDFRQSEMAGINSLLLDSVCAGGRGVEAGGETRKHLFMIFSFKSIYLTLQSVM